MTMVHIVTKRNPVLYCIFLLKVSVSLSSSLMQVNNNFLSVGNANKEITVITGYPFFHILRKKEKGYILV
jgi:hypothetical protein